LFFEPSGTWGFPLLSLRKILSSSGFLHMVRGCILLGAISGLLSGPFLGVLDFPCASLLLAEVMELFFPPAAI